MTDRERLIELVKKGEREFSLSNRPVLDIEEYIADYLLANGVIVAPMPMAEWLRQELTEYIYKRCMEEL